ncbi:MAG: glycoside hydrolase family 9 protein, partial [Bacteroidaceae bacterium]|nr:glycoside hydrolase family 9 protein [Bacteroidaceae bacterium]
FLQGTSETFWMLTMQDEDGGVYHKLTTPEFEDFVMPSECRKPRYVVKKTTCATLDFAATMALASRVFQPYERQTPGFSEKAINAAKKAYIWALKNPKVYYSQKELNNQYDPKISTGEYGDNDSNDEFFWAACELYNSTQTNIYLLEIKSRKPKTFKAPVWGEVGSMGIMSWLTYWSNNPRPRTPEITEIFDYGKQMLVKWADEYINGVDKTIYLSPFGNKKEDFHWASMAEGAATEAIILAQAFNLTKEKKYLVNARRNADYIFGRNATGYCFVTGFGDKSPMHPHHRISASDNVEKPVPGLLVGGPNAKANEGDFYESEQPDKRYADNQGSFMTNEIAINWNSALVVMTAALETFKSHSY